VLLAKAGAAALHAGDLSAAADYYAGLAKSRARLGEAVDGLERVVRAAVDARDKPAFSAAIGALRNVAPSRAMAAAGQDVAWLLSGDVPGKEMLDLLTTAAAHAPDGGRQDSLVFLYGLGLSRLDRCEDALSAFESVLRRQRVASVASSARRGAAQCALQLGSHALAGGQLSDAETWYTRAAGDLDDESLSRAAYLGLGDVRRGKGDLPGAAEAYQRVLTGARTGDTLAQAAALRLNAMAQAGTGGP
jgi:tetratricopeptide (TPR) repeat protein